MRYLPHTPSDIQAMLSTIGQSSIDELFRSIPQQAALARPLAIPAHASEYELKKMLLERAGALPKSSFLGAGATAHFVPELVSQMLLRSEWYTAYTPYQPEVSQGTLQAIFEFQTMTASLLGSEIANASMYDGATALAEAVLMAQRLKENRSIVLLCRSIHPEYRQVVHTFAEAADLSVSEIPLTPNGVCDEQALQQLLTVHEGKIAAVAFQTPNFFGQLENGTSIVELAHKHDCIAIAANAEPVAFGVIKRPGEYGADICVSEGIGLCGALHMGAPGVGLFATKQRYVRQMPGRLAGQTVDSSGKRGFVLTLSTREQHIRREKATSNICTNHNLMALAFSIALSTYGKQGFVKLAQENMRKTILLRRMAEEQQLKLAFTGPHFNESVIRFTSEAEAQQRLSALEKEGVFGGLLLSRWYPEYEGCVLVCSTELHTESELKMLITTLARG